MIKLMTDDDSENRSNGTCRGEAEYPTECFSDPLHAKVLVKGA